MISADRGKRWALAAAALAVVLGAASARGDIDGDRFESRAWRVRITAPRNWQLTEKTAYPSVLLRMVRRAPDGKMLLTAERLPPGTSAEDYAKKTAELMRTMRFSVRAPQLHSATGAYLVDSHRDRSFLRQAFLVAGGIGYSLTLAAPDNRTRSQHLRAFDAALRSIQIIREEELERQPAPEDEAGSEPPPPEPDPGAGSGASGESGAGSAP
ncbi:MAG TPA: hypothetical protein VKZ63_01995 [Kofleriaceae bacterium]|nr:hypothetical protein [Kofleriaceae bacterium]